MRMRFGIAGPMIEWRWRAVFFRLELNFRNDIVSPISYQDDEILYHGFVEKVAAFERRLLAV